MASNGTSTHMALPGHYDPMAAALALVPKVLDREALATWIAEKSDPALEKEQCMLFSLTHDTEDRGPVVVTQETIGKALGESERAARVAKVTKAFAAASEAQTETANATKPQRFIVGAHLRAHKDEHALFQYLFVLTPPPEIAARQEAETGMSNMLGHITRRADASVKLMSETLLEVTKMLVERDRERDARTDAMEASRFDMRVKCEELLDNRSLREVAAEKERQAMQINAHLVQAALMFGGALVKKHLAEGTDTGLADFVKVVDPSKIVNFIGQLSDEEKAAFGPTLHATMMILPADKQAALQEAIQQGIADGVEKKEGDK